MKPPNDFRNQHEWEHYVRTTVSPEDVSFTLATGLTNSFREFYQLRSQPFPEHFSGEIERISALSEPERTEKLEALNQRIMADATRFLMKAVGVSTESEPMYEFTPRGMIDGLLGHLRTKNPYFALWSHYQDNVAGRNGAPKWSEYVVKAMGVGADREIDFALLVSEMGCCLDLYHERGMRLPKHFYFQIWFLHRSNGPERNAMTRALVQELVEDLEPCGSA